MSHGVISRNCIDIGTLQLWIDYQDQGYFGERSVKYYVPSTLNDDCWGIDFTRQFKTQANCERYLRKCIKQTCKQILKDI